jgi:hypothetical protein
MQGEVGICSPACTADQPLFLFPTFPARKRIQFAEEPAAGLDRASGGGGEASTAGGGKRPASARRKKSIRIILDDDKDHKSDSGSIASMLERKIRFEDSPSASVTPIDSKGSMASNDTSLFDDKVGQPFTSSRALPQP